MGRYKVNSRIFGRKMVSIAYRYVSAMKLILPCHAVSFNKKSASRLKVTVEAEKFAKADPDSLRYTAIRGKITS